LRSQLKEEAMPADVGQMSDAVVLSEVTIAFQLPHRRAYTAIEKASLRVANGEFVAIVGPTGCGKSTLLNVAAGLLMPSAGQVQIFGARRREPTSRLPLSGRGAISMENCDRERCDRS
jgi:ABC-type lipoprotein export system ATPase subunit